MSHICHNGAFLPTGKPVLPADNRGYRYGDGIFETLRMKEGKILLEELHAGRLISSFSILKFGLPAGFSMQEVMGQVAQLCKMNECEDAARVRLSFSRGNGSLSTSDPGFDYIIECDPLKEKNYEWNKGGLEVDIYPHARKSCDPFSNLKSANSLPYVMAVQHARENNLDDCLVLNTGERIADSTIANIFIIKNGQVCTPSDGEGCVSGVMRRWLIDSLKGTKENVKKMPVTIPDLEQADEVFLTNAIRGIQWVRKFREKTYKNEKTREIFENCIKPIGTDQLSNLGFTKLFSFDPKR